MRGLLALLGTFVVVGLAAPAHADPRPSPAGDDAGFLAALHQVGISYASPDAAVASARAVCTCLDNGESGLELIQDVKTRNPGMDLENASHFALVAAKFYCPHHLSKA
jgi:hypothetical protein